MAQTDSSSLLINIDSVINISKSHSHLIKKYSQDLNKTKADLIQAKEWYFPTIYAGAMLHQLHGASMNADGKFFTDVDRQNTWAGIGANIEWDPGKSSIMVAAIKKRLKSDEYSFRAFTNELILNNIEVYLKYKKQLAVVKSVISINNVSEKIAKQILIQVKAGKRYKSDLLMAKTNHRHFSIMLVNAEKELKNLEYDLFLGLNIDDGQKLLLEDTLLREINELVNLDALAYKNRPELKSRIETISSLQKEKLTQSLGLFIPALRLNAYQSVFGDIDTDLYNTNELNTALLWRFSLSDIFSRGKLKSYNAGIKGQIDQLNYLDDKYRSELLKHYNAWVSSKSSSTISREALGFAQESMDQTIARQALRTAKPFEVYQAQEYLLRAQMDYFQSVYENNLSYYFLKLSLGNSF